MLFEDEGAFGRYLLDAKAKTGKSLIELQEEVGGVSLDRLHSGEYVPSEDKLQKLAEAYQIADMDGFRKAHRTSQEAKTRIKQARGRPRARRPDHSI